MLTLGVSATLRNRRGLLNRETCYERIHKLVKIGDAHVDHVPVGARIECYELHGRKPLVYQYWHLKRDSRMAASRPARSLGTTPTAHARRRAGLPLIPEASGLLRNQRYCTHPAA